MSPRVLSGAVWLQVNFARGWRDSLGATMRALADAVDGRRSLAVRVESTPAVGEGAAARAIELGMEHAYRLLRSELREALIDEAIRDLQPELSE